MVRNVPGAVAVLWLSPVLAWSAAIGPMQPLGTPAGPGSGEGRLTAGPGQTVGMSWLEPRSTGGHRLLWALWQGRKWSKPLTIAEGDSFFVNWADFPSLRWLGGDRWVAHWLWRTGGATYGYDVRLSFSEDGGRTWGPPIVPHRDGTETEHGFATVIPDSGRARAFWLDGRRFAGRDENEHPGPDMTLRTALIGPDGSIRNEAELDGRTCDCCATTAVRTTDGVLVAYRDRSDQEVRDVALLRADKEGWTAPETLHADKWKIAGCPVNGPAADAAGNQVAIAWFTAAADTPRVHAAWSLDGGRHFAEPSRMDLGNPLGRVGIVILADGSAVVVWLEVDEKQAKIIGRRLARSGEVGPAIPLVATSSARASGFPQIVRAGNDLLLAWTESARSSQVHTARMPAAAFLKPAGRAALVAPGN